MSGVLDWWIDLPLWQALGVLLAFLAAIFIVVASIAGYFDRRSQVPFGRIVSLDHHPAYVTTTLVPMTTGKTTTYVPQTHHHPERWGVTVEGSRRDGKLGRYE